MKENLSKKIIIVEDNAVVRRNLELLLQALGHVVLNSYEKIELEPLEKDLASGEVELLLLDINLPGEMSGVDFATKVKDRSNVPIIYITGNMDSEVFQNATQTLMYGFLPKPFNKVQLDYAIRVAIVRQEFELLLKKEFERIKSKEKMIQMGEVAGGLIHDLSNFNSIVLMSFMGIEEFSSNSLEDELMAKINDFSKRGYLGAQRIEKLANQYRKLIANDTKIEFERIKVDDLFKSIEQYFGQKFAINKITLKYNCEPNLTIFGSEIIILQSLVNLVSNAMHSIVEQNCIERWIELSAIETTDKLILDVIDSGPGVNEDNIPYLFEPNFSTKNLTSESGMGMGLSFVKSNITQKLSGEIHYVDSDEFSTFRIELPLKGES